MPSTLASDPAPALAQLDRLTVAEILELWKLLPVTRWRLLTVSNLQRAFVDAVLPGALLALVTAQEAAAAIGGNSVVTSAVLAPANFAGLAADGYELPTKLAQPLITVYKLLSGGMGRRQALAVGGRHMDQVVTTEIHDVSRSAEQVAITAERTYTGWEREIEAGACSRCVVLAGRVYRWSDGFKRHPKCRCHHVPTSLPVGRPSAAPAEYFDGLSREEQDRVFTAAGAEAIRQGADLSQVVNARQGMYEIAGHKVTTSGTTRRGWYSYQQRAIAAAEGQATGESRSVTAGGKTLTRIVRPRLLPEEIYKAAGNDRGKALTMLTENGYIVGDPQEQARRVVASRAVPLT